MQDQSAYQPQAQEFAARPRLMNRAGPMAGFGHTHGLGNTFNPQQTDHYRPGTTGHMPRDPYRQFVKIAPQNIMYDRRVVRGNTFAALVIPVHMQPEATMLRSQQAKRRPMRYAAAQNSQNMAQSIGGPRGGYSQDQNSQQHPQYDSQQNKVQTGLQSSGDHDTQVNTHWEELSDYQNMIDEHYLEPDYYIDRPPSALFVPDEAGADKATEMNDRQDPDLFDFDLEVEPVLQVLVGKALELAQIEVIEVSEAAELDKHKQKWKQIKESELMLTQRAEAAQNRRNNELDRRNLQQRTRRGETVWAEKREIAKCMSKRYLQDLRKNTLDFLLDVGMLRKPFEFQFDHDYVPSLLGQVQSDLEKKQEAETEIDNMIYSWTNTSSFNHRNAILAEKERREEFQKEQYRLLLEKNKATQLRRQNRANAREKLRISNLQDVIIGEIVSSADKTEWSPKIPVLDIRDYPSAQKVSQGYYSDPQQTNSSKGALFTIGGFIGEVVITLSALVDYIQANPAHSDFKLNEYDVERFLFTLLSPESGFPKDTINLVLNRNPQTSNEDQDSENEDQQWTSQSLGTFASNPSNLGSFGLRFLFDSGFILNPDVVEELFKVICSIATRKPTSASDPADDQSVDNAQASVGTGGGADTSRSYGAKGENEKLADIQSKVKLTFLSKEEFGAQLYDDLDEKCLMRVQNYREEPASNEMTGHTDVGPIDNSMTTSQVNLRENSQHRPTTGMTQHSGSIGESNAESEFFAMELIPKQSILVPSVSINNGVNMIVQHTEACYFVRKHIIEVAQKIWTELSPQLQVNTILSHTASKQRNLNARLEEHCLSELGYGRGCQYEDRNIKINYKTFLEKEEEAPKPTETISADPTITDGAISQV